MNLGQMKSVCTKVAVWPNRAQFTLTNVDYRLVNSLRHVLLEEIPCLAFHNFRFSSNNTVLKHEQIMQILRMIRVSSQATCELKWTKDCECENKTCEWCSVQFELDVTNDSQTYKSVTTKDFVATPRTECLLRHPVQFLHVMEIVKLAPGQSIKFIAIAQVGIGREHGKWVCVPTMIYQGLPLIPIDNFRRLPRQTQSDIARNCPKRVFSFVNEQLDIEDLLACTACDECLRIAHDGGDTYPSPNMELSNSDFQIKIETDGRYSVEEVLRLAFSILKKKSQFMNK